MAAPEHNFKASDGLNWAGDVRIDRVILKTVNNIAQNITNQVMQIKVYEDIFAPFMTGTLVVRESFDLNNIMPLTGEEILNLRIKTPTIDGAIIDQDFFVYKMTDKVRDGDKVQMYQLHFISIEALIDSNKKLSKVYSGKITDIIPTFAFDKADGLQTNKKFIVEPCRNTIKYCSNFWTPLENIQFLSENAISETQSPSYLFFENRDGFNFKSLDRMYTQPAQFEFTLDKYTRDSMPFNQNMLNSGEDYKRMGSFEVQQAYDYLANLMEGALGSKLISYDSTKKTYTVKNYDAFASYGAQNHLNSYPTFTGKTAHKSDSYHIIFPRAFETFTSFGDTTNARILQERISVLKLSHAQRVGIDVPGRLDYTVGQVVKVKVYQTRPMKSTDTEKDYIDKVFSGKYIVSALTHVITRAGHECYMELSRDSMPKNPQGE